MLGHVWCRRVLVVFMTQLLFVLLTLVIWYLISDFILSSGIRDILFPEPHIVFSRLGDSNFRRDLMTATSSTATTAAIGMLIASVIGVSIAILMATSKFLEKAIYPIAVIFQTVPVLALVPLISLWFRNQDTWFFWLNEDAKKKAVICVLIGIFPIVTNTFFGLQSVDKGLHEIFTLHQTGRWTRLKKLQIPASIPFMFVGFRIAAGLSVIGAIVSEFFFGKGGAGIGSFIDKSRGLADASALLIALIASSLIGVTSFLGFSLFGRLLTIRWLDVSGKNSLR